MRFEDFSIHFFQKRFLLKKQTPQIIFLHSNIVQKCVDFFLKTISTENFLHSEWRNYHSEWRFLHSIFFSEVFWFFFKKIYRDFFHSELRLLHSNRRFLYSFKRIIFLYSEFSVLILICFLPFQIDMSCSILNGDLSSLTSEIQNIFTLETAPSILTVLLFS